MTESTVCRTERANPAQFVAFYTKDLDIICGQKF